MTMLTAGHRSGFDLAEHTFQMNLTLLTATRDIGWTGRDLYSKDVLDPHAVWRHLRFLKFQITVRDAILAGLDEAIARAGHVLGFSATITFSGRRLPTVRWKVLCAPRMSEFGVCPCRANPVNTINQD